MASKRLVTHATYFSPTAFEKGPRQRYWQLFPAPTLPAGAGKRSAEDSCDSSQFLPKLLSGHQDRKRKRLVLESVSGGELRSTPAHPRTVSHPYSDAPPPPQVSGRLTLPTPRAASASFLSFPSVLYSNLSSFMNPEVSSQDERPGEGTPESGENPTEDRGGLRDAESAGCRGKRGWIGNLGARGPAPTLKVPIGGSDLRRAGSPPGMSHRRG